MENDVRLHLPLDPDNAMHQFQCTLGVFLRGDMPIAANARFQVQRLADVKQLIILAVKEIDPRHRRQCTKEIRPQPHRKRILDVEQFELDRDAHGHLTFHPGAEVQQVQLQPLHSFPRCEVQGAAATVILNRCCTCSTSVNTIRFLFLVFRFRIDKDACGLLQ